MKDRPSRRRSLLTRLSVQLVFVVLVPVIIVLSSSSFLLMNAITDEIAKSAGGQLKVASRTSQMMDDLVLNSATRIAIDARLERLTRTPRFAEISRSPETQFAFMEFLRDLGEVVRTDSLFHSIHIVVDNVDWIISSLDGVVQRSEFSDRLWLDSLVAMDINERAKALRKPHIPALVATIGSGQGLTPETSNQTLIRLYPLTPYLTTLSGWIILELDEREFSRRINSSHFGTEGAISVVDSQGVYVSAVDRSQVGKPVNEPRLLTALESSPNPQGFLTIAKPDGDHLLTWYRPGGDSVVFVGDFSLAQLNRSLGNLRWMTIGLSLAIILVGIVGMSLISVRFFNPVRRMVNELREHAAGEGAQEGNELDLLENALSALLRQENQLFSTVERQRRLRSEAWVNHAVRGTLELTEDEVPEVLEGRPLRVGLLLIDRAEAVFAGTSPEKRRHLLGVLVHMTEHAFEPELVCVAAPWNDRAVAIVFGQSPNLEELAVSAATLRGFEALKQELGAVLPTSLTLCLAPKASGIWGLNDGWTACEGMARQRFLAGYGHLFDREEALPSGTTLLPRQEIRAVLSALESGQAAELEAPLKALTQSIRSRPGLGYDNAILIYSQVVAGLIRHLIDLSLRIDQVYGPGCDLQAELASIETLEGAQIWLSSRLVRALENIKDESTTHHAGTIATYLQANFRRDFGIEEVADHVRLSYSHVRKVFQQEFGESIVGYVNSLRIEEAKRLLLETDQTLERVARQSGYNNMQSLTRYFKKFTGQTPGEFRSQRRGR